MTNEFIGFTPLYYRDLNDMQKNGYLYSWNKKETVKDRECLIAVEKEIDIQVGVYFDYGKEEIQD